VSDGDVEEGVELLHTRTHLICHDPLVDIPTGVCKVEQLRCDLGDGTLLRKSEHAAMSVDDAVNVACCFLQ